MNKLNQFEGDALDDFLGERTSTPRALVAPPANYQPKDFSEPCAKCRGTGKFIGYSGRTFGPCFTCKGAGKKTFKTSAANSHAVKIEQFKADHPTVWAWMDGSDFRIAVEFRAKLEQYGSLTDNQVAAALRMIQSRDDARAAAQAVKVERVAAAPTIDMAKIEEAFATARANGLKKIKVRFVGLTFQPAKAESANAGALYVKEGQQYLGKIVGGKFMASRECGAERSAKVLEIAADPKAAAVAYGKLTGSCSCCGRELSDPVSVANGIGPWCMKKFGWE